MMGPFFDAALNLELAEHAWLRSQGWWWAIKEKHLHHEPMVVWMAPSNHKGSQHCYESRAHAINSCKRWNLNNPLLRLKVRGDEDRLA